MGSSTNPIVQDWVHGPPPPEEPPADPQLRKLALTPASAIRPRRVRWLWKDRIAYGTLALLAGREGLGKSTLGYKLAADVTNGTLEGEDWGTPRAVLVCAAEDSWEHTIVPRLIAAGANLTMVYRVEIETWDGMRLGLSLPRDWTEAETAAKETGAGLMVLDPLMSVIDAKLDTHRDREVRQALEPLAALADRARMAILGLIHHNKSGSTDALQLVMGSKAFAAVARSVHTCIPDPDDETETRKLFATSKNNLGRLDLPVLGFTITSHPVETEDDGLAWTGRLHWTGEVNVSMNDIMRSAADPERGATAEASAWLTDYLTDIGGTAAKVDIEKAGRVAGHAPRTLQRARERLRYEVSSEGFPRRTFWSIPGTQVDPNVGDQPLPEGGADDPISPDPETSKIINGANSAPSNESRPVMPMTPTEPQSRQVAPTLAPLGATGPDLRKRQEPSRAYAQGESQVGATEDLAQLPSQSRQVAPVAPSPHVRAYARGPDHDVAPDSDLPPPLCDDCGFAIDTTDHQLICEEP